MRINEISAEISVIRSARRTLAAEIRPDGTVLVRAPIKMSEAQITRFLTQKATLIEKHLQKQLRRKAEADALPPFTSDEIRAMADQALKVIPERVKYYAPLVGVTYGRITIRNQKSRWGSCSSIGNLNFNCLLMMTPPEVLDSVVVHELCHRLQPNHSAKFYAEVYRVFPDYDRCDKWLKEHGPALIRRMTG